MKNKYLLNHLVKNNKLALDLEIMSRVLFITYETQTYINLNDNGDFNSIDNLTIIIPRDVPCEIL